MSRCIKRTLISRDSRKYHDDRVSCIANLEPLVADSQTIPVADMKHLNHQDGNWIFVTISMDPKVFVQSGSKDKKRFNDCSYTEQLETCLRYYETVYFNYLRGFSFGTWELDSSGKLHVHILHHSEDQLVDTYVVPTIRHGVRTDSITQQMTKGRVDYCNSIVFCTDPPATLHYLMKDHDKKKGFGLPQQRYFYWSII